MNGKGIVFIGLVAMLCVLLLVESGVALALQRRKSRGLPSQQRVEELYRGNCARCHGADGRGDTPLGRLYNAPDFTDQGWWQEHAKITSTKSLFSIVTRGKGNMPAFGKKLNRSEISLLVKHMRRFRVHSGATNSR